MILVGSVLIEGVSYVAMAPVAGSIDPIALRPVGTFASEPVGKFVRSPVSVNQTWPSGPAAIAWGKLLGVGRKKVEKAPVAGLNDPIRLACDSVYQRAPSGPSAIPVSPGVVVVVKAP